MGRRKYKNKYHTQADEDRIAFVNEMKKGGTILLLFIVIVIIFFIIFYFQTKSSN